MAQRTARVILEGPSTCQEAKLLEDQSHVMYERRLCVDRLAVGEKKKLRDRDKKSDGGGGGS